MIQQLLRCLPLTLFSSLYRLEDIIVLLTFVFSLMGDEFYDSPAEIEKLKVWLIIVKHEDSVDYFHSWVMW